MRPRYALTVGAIALIASVTILSGCGSSGATDSASQPSVTTEATTTTTAAPLTQAEVNTALLQISDLPAGYSSAANDSSSSSTSGTFCKEARDSLPSPQNNGGPDAGKVSFEKSKFGPILVEQLFVSSDAAKAFGRVKDAINLCTAASWTTPDSSGAPTTNTLAPMSFPPHGNEQIAFRLTNTSRTLQLEGTVVLVRIDNVIALIAGVGTTSMFGSFPLDIDQFSDVVDTAVGKLEAL